MTTLKDLFEAACQRGAFCISRPDGTLRSAGEMSTDVQSAMRLLRDRGVAREDVVLYRGDQSEAAFVWFWAAIAVGGIFVPVDATATAHQLSSLIERLRPRVMIEEYDAGAPMSEVPAPVLSAACFREPPLPLGLGGWEAMPHGSAAAYLLTSGSTAEPKIVVLSHEALADSARRVCNYFGWRPGERLLNLPAPHTMSGLRNAFIAAPLGGLRWIPSPRRERNTLSSLLTMIETAAAQRLVAAPTLIRQINLLGDRVPESLFASVAALYCTGTDLSASEVKRFHDRFQRPIVNYYGLTETVGLCITQRIEQWHVGDDSIGKPADCDVRLVDGELQVRQRFPMSGYFKDAAATAAAFDDGWFRTGDRASLDGDGCVRITGRLGTFIKTSLTEKVSPVEVEAVLEQHLAIREAAVCGIPDRGGGERIAALLVARHPGDSNELQRNVCRWVAQHLGEARAPTIVRWTQALPRTSSGKIQRSVLSGYFDA